MTEFDPLVRTKIQKSKKQDGVDLVATCSKQNSDVANHYYVSEEGEAFAGRHLIVDLFGASKLDDLEVMEQCLRDCVDASGTTLLNLHLHHFEPNGGISGVVVLAESHISVHSWPETGYCAFDAFMCGATDPHACISVLKASFGPKTIKVRNLLRGNELYSEPQS